MTNKVKIDLNSIINLINIVHNKEFYDYVQKKFN